MRGALGAAFDGIGSHNVGAQTVAGRPRASSAFERAAAAPPATGSSLPPGAFPGGPVTGKRETFRRILFGSADSDEKHAAALEALAAAGVPVSQDLETRGSCADGAIEVAEATGAAPPVAVISSYALPLLEGCGNNERGALRVLAETRPVPFITVFCNDRISQDTREALNAALLVVGSQPPLLKAMESRAGFVPWISPDWTDWRGPNRDGHVDWLPDTLPPKLAVLWTRSLLAPGLAGPAATREIVLLPERNPLETGDVFRCFRVSDGQTLWSLSYDAPGSLDYDNSPRATPVIAGETAFLLGAHGELHCVRVSDGFVLWKRHLVKDLGGVLPTWGYCGTPLVTGELVVGAPGGKDASIAALDRQTGTMRWQTPGPGAAHSSLIAGTFGGRRQIVGYDAISLGGWDPHTGERLWTLVPPTSGDFNVPTPVAWRDRLFVATENNGARLYGFDRRGRIHPQPLSINETFCPETSSPVIVGTRVFGCASELRSLTLSGNLEETWRAQDVEPTLHATLMATEQRVLIFTHEGELALVDPTGAEPRTVARQRVLEAGTEVYAHPAISARRLFLRNDTTLYCLRLD
jgi:hypothetical protein